MPLRQNSVNRMYSTPLPAAHPQQSTQNPSGGRCNDVHPSHNPSCLAGRAQLTYQPPAATLRAVHAQEVPVAVKVQHAVQQMVLGLKDGCCCVEGPTITIILSCSSCCWCWGLPARAGVDPAAVFAFHQVHECAGVLQGGLARYDEMEPGV